MADTWEAVVFALPCGSVDTEGAERLGELVAAVVCCPVAIQGTIPRTF